MQWNRYAHGIADVELASNWRSSWYGLHSRCDESESHARLQEGGATGVMHQACMDRALPLAPGVNRGARIISNASGRAAAAAVTHAGAACSMVVLVRTPAHPSALNCAIRREGALLPKTGIDG